MTDNLRIWDKVSKTNPAFTKKVTQGPRHFTTIDAYHQIQAATEQFGPVGQNWGWAVTDQGVLENSVWVRLTFWWSGETKNMFDVYGGAMHLTKDGKVFSADEAYKKALTDAITKALSYLGFSADVFLGRFDDNKYVAGLQKEFSEAAYASLIEQFDSAKTVADLEHVAEQMKSMVDQLSPEELKRLREQYKTRHASFNNPKEK